VWQISIVHRPFIVPGCRRSSPKTVSCNADEISDDRDLLPLMCHPLQSLQRCTLVAGAYRAKSKSCLAVSAGRIGIQPCFHSSLLKIFGGLHSPPTSASAFLSSPVTAEVVKRLSPLCGRTQQRSFTDIGSRQLKRYRHTCRNAQGLSR
jgi:hypothetical protein